MQTQSQNRQYVYSKLESSLRQQILSGQLDHTHPLPGELALADTYKISRPSVRKAINTLVKEGLLTRYRGGGTYVVPPENRSVNIKQKNLHILIGIGYLNRHGVSEYDEPLLESASEYAFRNGHTLSYFDSNDFDPKRILNRYAKGEVDGIIWLRTPNEKSWNSIVQCEDKRIPQLVFDRRFGNVPLITNDNYSSLNRIITFLSNYGHQKIGFVNLNSEAVNYQEREQGYFAAMQEKGLGDISNCYLKIANRNFDSRKSMITSFLKNITALIIGGHSFLKPFLSIIEELEIRIPDDLSVVCIDDSFAARSYNPSISVYSQSRAEQGKHMMQVIESAVNNQLSPGEKIVTKGELIIRESCKPLVK
jgi:LacI family transcriptional regulator